MQLLSRPTAMLLLALAWGAIAPLGCANTGDSGRPGRAPGQTGFDISLDSLTDPIVRKTLDEMHWGLGHVGNTDAELDAYALTDDDRRVDIRAVKTPDGRADVKVSVGFFGDPRLEGQFLEALGKQIDLWKKRQAEKLRSEKQAANKR
jgi:hypothetical protein